MHHTPKPTPSKLYVSHHKPKAEALGIWTILLVTHLVVLAVGILIGFNLL